MAVLLTAGTAAARAVATDPQPTRAVTAEAVTAEAAAAPAPAHDAASNAHDARAPEPAAAGTGTSTSPAKVTAASAAVAPPPSTPLGPPDPAPTATTAAPTTRVAPPPTVVVPSMPPPASLETVAIGPGAWRSTYQGITATLRITPITPRVGEVVHFSIDTTFTGEGCCMVFLYPGDGAIIPPENNSMDCTHAPGALHRELSHIYTQADRFTVHVQPSVLPCRITPDGLAAPINSQLYTSILINPAT